MSVVQIWEGRERTRFPNGLAGRVVDALQGTHAQPLLSRVCQLTRHSLNLLGTALHNPDTPPTDHHDDDDPPENGILNPTN
ncbi:hypothetical protein GCM10022207_88070 [Streptomyces lannensis]|uniref:Transposase n=1 Tax=Streptomyces lannensis TaxID=766498 RepID=A0ABP7LSK8_9ACTN